MTGIITLNKLKRQQDMEVVKELLMQMLERDNKMLYKDFTFVVMNEESVSKRTAQEYIDASLNFLKLKFKKEGGVEEMTQ